jgi:hypothetical protein
MPENAAHAFVMPENAAHAFVMPENAAAFIRHPLGNLSKASDRPRIAALRPRPG